MTLFKLRKTFPSCPTKTFKHPNPTACAWGRAACRRRGRGGGAAPCPRGSGTTFQFAAVYVGLKPSAEVAPWPFAQLKRTRAARSPGPPRATNTVLPDPAVKPWGRTSPARLLHLITESSPERKDHCLQGTPVYFNKGSYILFVIFFKCDSCQWYLLKIARKARKFIETFLLLSMKQLTMMPLQMDLYESAQHGIAWTARPQHDAQIPSAPPTSWS